MKLVTLAAFNAKAEAEPLCAQLRDAGIAAEIRPDAGVAAGGFVRPSAGVRLEVPRGDFERALRLVYDWNTGGEATVAERELQFDWMRGEERVSGPTRPGRG